MLIPRWLEAIRRPEIAPGLDADGWNALLPRLRHARLVGRFAERLQARGLIEAIPAEAAAQLRSAMTHADAVARALRFEAGEIMRALADAGVEAILIKGAAHAAADWPCARGRLASDIDVLL